MYWDQETTIEKATKGGTSYQEKDKDKGISYSEYIDTRIADTKELFDEKIKRLELRIENVEKDINKLNEQKKSEQEHKFSWKLGITIAIISGIVSLLVNWIISLFSL